MEELECGAERKSGEAGETEIQSTKKRENGVKGGGFLPLTIHLRGNPTNFPPFPLFQLRMLKLSHQPWCRKHNSRSLPLDASRRDAMIRSIELDLRLEFSRGWGMITKDGITKRRNWFAHEQWKILFPIQKTHPDLISNFPRKEQKEIEISQQNCYFNSNVKRSFFTMKTEFSLQSKFYPSV